MVKYNPLQPRKKLYIKKGASPREREVKAIKENAQFLSVKMGDMLRMPRPTQSKYGNEKTVFI